MVNVEIDISDKTLNDYDVLRDACGLVSLPNHSLISIKGEDRKGWLQGQATNDLRKLEPGASSEFCLTTVTGHLMTVCESWAVQDFILLTCPTSTVPDLLNRVEQMVILEDVVAEDVSSKYRLLSIQGPTATQQLTSIVALPSLDAGEATLKDATVYCLRSNRTGLGGWDIWVPTEHQEVIDFLIASFPSIGEPAYNIARLEAGIPEFGTDMGEKTFPPEMGSQFESRHVSYTKGCYMGQEVLMRIHSRGHTNKTWVGLVSEHKIEVGATIKHLNRADAGVVTSSGFSPDFGHIAAAMVRNEAAFEAEQVEVTLEGHSVVAEVKMMPFLRLG